MARSVDENILTTTGMIDRTCSGGTSVERLFPRFLWDGKV